MIRPHITKCEYCDKELPDSEFTTSKGRYPCCDPCNGTGGHWRPSAIHKRQSVAQVQSTKRTRLEQEETVRDYLEPETTKRDDLEE